MILTLGLTRDTPLHIFHPHANGWLSGGRTGITFMCAKSKKRMKGMGKSVQGSLRLRKVGQWMRLAQVWSLAMPTWTGCLSPRALLWSVYALTKLLIQLHATRSRSRLQNLKPAARIDEKRTQAPQLVLRSQKMSSVQTQDKLFVLMREKFSFFRAGREILRQNIAFTRHGRSAPHAWKQLSCFPI